MMNRETVIIALCVFNLVINFGRSGEVFVLTSNARPAIIMPRINTINNIEATVCPKRIVIGS